MPSLRFGLLSVVALALAAFVTTTSRAQEGDGAASAPHGPPPASVRVVELHEQLLAPRKRVFGDLRPARYATIAAEEAGIVSAVAVREGDVVERDAVLARVDDARLIVELNNNKRAIASADATVRERTTSLDIATRHYTLLEKAAAAGGANPRELLDAESAREVARSQLTQASAALDVLLGEAMLLGIRVADLEVRAPFRGVVTRKHTEIGAWLGAGDPVVELAETTHLEASLEVPQELFETALAQAKLMSGDASGTTAIELRDARDQSVRATKMRVIPAIDPRSRTFRAVLDVDNADGAFAAGLTLTAYVPAGQAVNRLVVPKDAILRGDAGPFVYAVRGGIAMAVNIAVAFPVGELVAVEPGALHAGDVVVTEGNERLMPMSPVAPIVAGSNQTPAIAEGAK